MYRLLIALSIFATPALADISADDVGPCNDNLNAGGINTNYARSTSATETVAYSSSPVSITLPITVSHLQVRFHDSTDWTSCFDSSFNNWCGTSDGGNWEFKPTVRRLVPERSNIPLNVMWVSTTIENGQVRYSLCKEGK